MERRKVAAPGEGRGGLGVGVESKVFSQLPNTLLHCAMMQYSDGSVRTPGYLQIRVQDGQWQVTAIDPDACAIQRCEDALLDNALVGLELLMGDPAVPWIQAPWLARQTTKKKK